MELDIERRVWSGDEAEDDDGEDDVREDYFSAYRYIITFDLWYWFFSIK